MNIKKKKFWLITILITITLLLVIPSYKKIANTQKYILKIDDFILYPNQFNTLVNNNLHYLIKNTSLKKNTLQYKQYKKKIQQEIINKIITDTLQKKYIKKLNYDITKNKIKANIFSNPLFLNKQKKFNKKKYLSYLTKNKINIYQYINFLKNDIKNKELINNLIKLIPWNYNNKLIMDNLNQIRSYKIAVLNMNSLIKNKINFQKIKKNEFFDYYLNNKNIWTSIQYGIKILDINKHINVKQLYNIKKILFIKHILQNIKQKKLYIYKSKKYKDIKKLTKNISNKNIPFINLPKSDKYQYIKNINLKDIKSIYEYLNKNIFNKTNKITTKNNKLNNYYYIFFIRNNKTNTYKYQYHYNPELHKKYNWITIDKIFFKKFSHIYNNLFINTQKKLYEYISKQINISYIYKNNYTLKKIKNFLNINNVSKIHIFLKNKNNIKNTIAITNNNNNNIYLIKYQKYIPKQKQNFINIIQNVIRNLILKQKIFFIKKLINNFINNKHEINKPTYDKYIKWKPKLYISTHKKNNIFSKYILNMKLSQKNKQKYIILYDYTLKKMYLLKLINIKYAKYNQTKLNKYINNIYTNISLLSFNNNLSKDTKIVYKSKNII